MQCLVRALILALTFVVAGTISAGTNCAGVVNVGAQDEWSASASLILKGIKYKKAIAPISITTRNSLSLIPKSMIEAMIQKAYSEKERFAGANEIYLSRDVNGKNDVGVSVSYFVRKGRDRVERYLYGAEKTNVAQYLKEALNDPSKIVIADDLIKMARVRLRDTTRIEMFRDNDFYTERLLSEYYNELSSPNNLPLSEVLNQLIGQGKVWVDLGAGSARPQRLWISVLKRRGIPQRDRPRVVAVGYAIPDHSRTVIERWINSGELTYVEGLQTAKTLKDLPQANLVTDDKGLFEYWSESQISYFKGVLEIVKPGGQLRISSFIGLAENAKNYLIRNNYRFTVHEDAEEYSQTIIVIYKPL